jgi:hypothetical protein
MSNLNLENIVGFKAVDKDGNEQNVTVDEMVDMVSTRMVMALSETSTFAAAAATGNDVYENELPTVTDAANVRVLQSSGDAAQMTMQSLASKLGELMNNLKLFPFMGMADISEGGDANELESGYYINGNFRKLTNSPFSSGWGGIIVFKINYYTLQIASDMNTKIFKVRQRWYNTWDDWKTVSLT